MDAEQTPLAARVQAEANVRQLAERITAQQLKLAEEITVGRVTAHAKHGVHSIEAQYSGDRLLAILTEEVGEVARAMNEYALGNLTHEEAGHAIRAELVDVLTAASAWAVKFDTNSAVTEHVARTVTVDAQSPEDAAQAAQDWLTGHIRS